MSRISLYQDLLFPLLRQFDAERMHDVTVALLALAQERAAGRRLLRQIAGEIPQRPVEAFGLTFPNVLGVAAGFDKEAQVAPGLAALGFGHVEVGTLTPYPQAGNPKPRIFRLPSDRALINRMGFPNEGVAQAVPQLRALPRSRSYVVGVSLGKQKETPLAEASEDYVTVMRAVYPYADYLAVNVSSPNTPGLRALQGGAYLQQLLGRLQEEGQRLAREVWQVKERPLLLKIAPDLTLAEVDEIVAVAERLGIGGIIAANTSMARAGLGHENRSQEGGLSGAPLAQRSNELIAHIHSRTEGRLPIVGVGGVFDAGDVCAKLQAGATLVQTYTGLVYEGPGMAGRVLRSERLRSC